MRWEIPLDTKNDFKAMNSPPLSEKKVFIFVLNLFSTKDLNEVKTVMVSDLCLRG